MEKEKQIKEELERVLEDLPKIFAKNRAAKNPKPEIEVFIFQEHKKIAEILSREGFDVVNYNSYNSYGIRSIYIRDPTIPKSSCSIL